MRILVPGIDRLCEGSHDLSVRKSSAMFRRHFDQQCEKLELLWNTVDFSEQTTEIRNTCVC